MGPITATKISYPNSGDACAAIYISDTADGTTFYIGLRIFKISQSTPQPKDQWQEAISKIHPS